MICQTWPVGLGIWYEDWGRYIGYENKSKMADTRLLLIGKEGKADVICYNRSFIEQILAGLARYNKPIE